MRNDPKTLLILLVFAAVIGGPIAALAAPLKPPVIRDRVILGQYSNNSSDAYDLTKKGDYLYVVGYPGLDTLQIVPSGGHNTLVWKDSDDSGAKMNGASTYGNFLYVANWSQGNGLRVFSISNQANPSSVRVRGTDYHTWESNVIDNVLHIAEGVSGPGTIRIYDLDRPAYPELTATLNPAQYQDGHVTNVAGANGYIYWGRGRWVYVYSNTDPLHPSYVTRRDLASLVQHVEVYNGYLYVTTAENVYSGTNPGGVYVFSLSNPAQPSNVKSGNGVSWEFSGGAGDFQIQNDILVLPAGRWMRVLNVADPTNVKTMSGMDPITIVWDDDGDGTAESPTHLPSYTGPDHFDGYTNCVTGAGDYIYAGTTESGFYNGNETYFGSRVYAIQITTGQGEGIADTTVIDFAAASNNGSVTLTWTNPDLAEFTGTMIRYRTDTYPTSTTDGTLLIDKSGTAGADDSTTHSSLTNGTTYYYTAWAHNSTPVYSLASSARATPTAATCYTEGFAYSDGNLNGNGSWSGTATTQITVTSGTVKVDGGTTAYDSKQTVTCGDPGTGVIQVSIDVKSGTGDTNMWNLYLDDTSGLNMARWYGAGTTARGRIGGTALVTASQVLTGSWDELVVRIDPYTKTTEFFFNGSSIGTLDYSSTGAVNTLGSITFERNNNSAAVGHYVYFDNLTVGGSDVLPPGPAANPSPADAATDVSITADLSWTAGNGATSHDVYFGTDSTPDSTEFKTNQSGVTYDPGTLTANTTYYWRIDEINSGGTTTGTVWSFTTVALPGAVSDPSPADSATSVDLDADISWTSATGATSYDVYFGTDSTPDSTEFQVNQGGTTYDPGTLTASTTYYWRIDSVNVAGTTTGTVWSFTTGTGLSVGGLNVLPALSYTIDGDGSDWQLGSHVDKSLAGEKQLGDIAITGYDAGTLYYGAYATANALPTDFDDHTATVYSTHDTSYLYFLIRCNDDDIQTDEGTQGDNWKNDCVEFYIDPSNDGGSTAMSNSTSDIQLVIDAANRQNVYVTTGGYKTQVLNGVTSAVSTDADGWWLEVEIDKTALDADIPDTGTFGLDFNYRDNDSDNSSSYTTVYTWAETSSSGFPSKIPDHWGTGELATLPASPDAATSPSPANSATLVSIEAELSWTAGARATSHDVYFGTDSTPDSSEYQGKTVNTTYGVGTLDPGTTYYWRIDEVNAGGTTTGTVWSFTTLPLPGSASSPSPSDSATGVSVTAQLSWTAGSNADTHNVHFGTTSPPTYIGNQSGTTYNPGTLTYGQTYYWIIDEVNASGTTEGTEWSFTAETDGVSVDLGATDVEDDLTRVVVGDGDTGSTTIGGKECRQNVDPANDFYMYFDVDDNWSYQGDNSQVYVRVEYYDTGTGILRLQYDSPGAETSDKYKVAGTTVLTNSNTWKTYCWYVSDAYFGNRQNGGADLRIFGGTNTTFYLNVVEVVATAIDVNPIAIVSANPTSGDAPLSVSFNSSSSSDTDGSLVGYAWDFDSDGTVDSTASSVTHSYTVNGDYTCTLVVTDDDGLTGVDTQDIEVLIGGCSVTVSNLNRYATTNYDIDDTYFSDRSYVIDDMPSYLDGALGIKTENDDKNATSESWITFNLDNKADVYIAYDPRATSLPNWMSSYTDTGDFIDVSGVGQDTADLYMKTFSSGSVTLGGNKATGASGALSNYFVLILPNCDDSINFDEFDSGVDGWTTTVWRAHSSYGFGEMFWASGTGNPYPSMRSDGTGQTDNSDSCLREGGIMYKNISTKGYEDVLVVYDLKFDTDQTGTTTTGGCTSALVEGDCADKLAIYYSSTGTSGSWALAEEVLAKDVADSTWLTREIDLSAVTAIDDNEDFALKFVFQFNHDSDKCRVDNIEVIAAQE
ncbi:MAG: PKD domain-containing protein [Planctomycetota bacterium]|jgi:hypothetical protein